MRVNLSRPRDAALAALLLALPLPALIGMAVANWEPYPGAFQEPVSRGMTTLSRVLLMGSFALWPLAIAVALAPVRGQWRAHGANVAVALAITAGLATLIALFALDQYPCWMGVANCD
jgi:hypothetical protein